MLLIAIVTFLIIDTAESRDRLISIIGFVVILGLGWIFSKHPGQASSTLKLEDYYWSLPVRKPDLSGKSNIVGGESSLSFSEVFPARQLTY